MTDTVTLTFTTEEAAAIAYAMEALAIEYNNRVHAEVREGDLSTASGRRERLMTTLRNSCLSIVRKIDAAIA